MNDETQDSELPPVCISVPHAMQLLGMDTQRQLARYLGVTPVAVSKWKDAGALPPERVGQIVCRSLALATSLAQEMKL